MPDQILVFAVLGDSRARQRGGSATELAENSEQGLDGLQWRNFFGAFRIIVFRPIHPRAYRIRLHPTCLEWREEIHNASRVSHARIKPQIVGVSGEDYRHAIVYAGNQ